MLEDVRRIFNLEQVRQEISWRSVRNLLFAGTIVFSGLMLAFVTLWAHRTGNPRIAGIAAAASLVFVLLILIFVIPPLARNASREVSQIDLPLELTTGGLVVFGLTVIVGFAAWNTGNNLLFVVFSMMVAAFIVSLVYVELNLRNLEIRVRFPDSSLVGEPTPVAVTLGNRKRFLPSVSVKVEMRGEWRTAEFRQRKLEPPAWLKRFLPNAKAAKRIVGYFVYMPRRHEREQIVEIIFPTRGIFAVRDLEISTKFPLALWKRRQRLKVGETRIYAVPRPENVGDKIDVRSLKAGQNLSRRRGGGQDLYALRDYQLSDDVRHIDWKATARTRKFIVREFTAEDERRVTIIFDTHFPSDEARRLTVAPPKTKTKTKDKKEISFDELAPLRERFENGVTMTASLLAHFIRTKSEVRLIVNEIATNYGADKGFFNRSLCLLAEVEPSFADKFTLSETQSNILNGTDDLVIFLTFADKNAVRFEANGAKQIIFL